MDGGSVGGDQSDRAGHAVGSTPRRENVPSALEHNVLSEPGDGVRNPDVQQCEHMFWKLDLRGSRSETLNVPFENGGDPAVRSKPVGAFSSGVFDRGKRGLSVSEGPEDGQVTRVSADVTSTGETAIRLWRVLSESLYGERMTRAGAEVTR